MLEYRGLSHSSANQMHFAQNRALVRVSKDLLKVAYTI